MKLTPRIRKPPPAPVRSLSGLLHRTKIKQRPARSAALFDVSPGEESPADGRR
jgi:hypothetical protein